MGIKNKKNYIFTNKKNSKRAVMAVILGIISLVSLGIVMLLSGLNGGAKVSYGFTGLFAAAFSLTGLLLGVVTVQDKDYYRLFPALGILLNFLALGAVSLILYAGANL